MKTLFILGSLIMTSLFFTACQTEDLATPGNARSGIQEARANATAVATYGGNAIGLKATVTSTQNGAVVSNQYNFANTGLLPTTGGSLNATHPQALVEGVLSADSLTASTAGQNHQTISTASASNLSLTFNGHVITADYVAASATTNCAIATGSIQIRNLVVNGTPVTVTGTPNQTIVLSPTTFLIINEQSTSKKVKGKNITVSALHVIGNSDIRVAGVNALTKC